MALAGYDTAYAVFNDTSNTTSYSGSLTVADGELIVLVVTGIKNNTANDTSAWTATLNGSAMTWRSGTITGLTVVGGVAAIFTAVASGSGSQTVALTIVNSCRGMAASAYRITGFDATTPIPAAGVGDNLASDVAALTSPNGVTTSADGNAMIGCIGINGGDVTALAVSGADGSTTGQTGTNAFNDAEWGHAYKLQATAGSVSFAWTWTTGRRPAAAWVEVAVAASSGTTVTPDSLSYTETLNDLSIAVDLPVPLDSPGYTETINDIAIAVDTPVALDSLDYTLTLPDLAATQRTAARGDDAFRTTGARERFWRQQAEEWLEEHYGRTLKATKAKRSARKRSAARIVAAAEAASAEMPQIAPQIDILARFARQLAEPQPDLTAIATAVAAQLEQMERERTTRRRKRDLEAILLLAA